MEKTPFWKKTWFIALMFFVFPLAGIILMWASKKNWNKGIKIVLSAIFGFFALGWIIILFAPSNESTTNATTQESQTIYVEAATEETTTTKPTTTEKETTTAKPTTTEKETTTAKPTTTEKETTTAKPTTTEKETTTAKPTTTKKETTTSKPTTTKKVTTSKSSNSEQHYVLNNNTKKFHYPSCSSADKIADKNRDDFNGNRDTLINRGFSPCGRCHP